MAMVYILNGPNLNLLGARQVDIYGAARLEDIALHCRAVASQCALDIDFRQSNHEGALVDWVQEANQKADGIILNAAAYTHSSIAIRDALQAGNIPVIEVHLSNIFKREDFRHHSFISEVATGVICGLGMAGYALAIRALADLLADNRKA